MTRPEVDRDTCYLCGGSHEGLLQQHHIVPRRFGGSDDTKNLVELCPTCHRKLERLYDHRFYEQLREHFRKELKADDLVETNEQSSSEQESVHISGRELKDSIKSLIVELEGNNEKGAPIDRVMSEHPKPTEDIQKAISELRTRGEIYEYEDNYRTT